MTDDSDISISINGVSHTILCGTCEQPIAFVGETDGKSGDAGCVICGNVANVEQVAKIASEYATDEAQLMLNRMARDVASKSSFMTFKGKTEHDLAHRFIVQLQI